MEPKPAAPLECPKPNDITTITLATRYLMARPDFERLRETAGYVALADVQPTQAAVTLGTAFVLALAFLAIHRSHRA